MAKFDNKMSASLNRMKGLMTYGLQTESKNNAFRAVENVRKGADGKAYGIIREGAKYYIKESSTPKDTDKLLSEDFNYIGGFGNRKNYEYHSFADAQKNFDLKLRSIREAYDNTGGIVIESWNPDRQEELTVESTEKLRKEILRERQIMANVEMLCEKKKFSGNAQGVDKKVGGEEGATQKNNVKASKHETGKPVGVGGDPFTEKATPTKEMNNGVCSKCGNKPCTCAKKGIKESADVLGWNDDEDYMDKSNGTEIGDSAPFSIKKGNSGEANNGVVEEGEVMHTSQNQNSPSVGVSEIGDDAPFDKKVNEDVDMGGDVNLTEEDGLEDDPSMMGDEAGMDGADPSMEDDGMTGEEEPEYELETDDEGEDDAYADDISMDLKDIKNLLGQIASKFGVADDVDTEYYDDDESLYDDEPVDDDVDLEMGMDESVVYESRDYRRLMKEHRNQVEDFGKHPAWTKVPFTTPSNQHQEFNGYYDMNDDSAKSNGQYGEEIGDSAPFDIDPDTIADSIAESIRRVLKKKSN